MSERLTKVDFSNLDKILFSKAGITKAQVVEYYIKLAPRMHDEKPVKCITTFKSAANHNNDDNWKFVFQLCLRSIRGD